MEVVKRGQEECVSPPRELEKSSLLTSHLLLFSWSRRLKAFLSGVSDILALLIATFAAVLVFRLDPGNRWRLTLNIINTSQNSRHWVWGLWGQANMQVKWAQLIYQHQRRKYKLGLFSKCHHLLWCFFFHNHQRFYFHMFNLCIIIYVKSNLLSREGSKYCWWHWRDPFN